MRKLFLLLITVFTVFTACETDEIFDLNQEIKALTATVYEHEQESLQRDNDNFLALQNIINEVVAAQALVNEELDAAIQAEEEARIAADDELTVALELEALTRANEVARLEIEMLQLRNDLMENIALVADSLQTNINDEAAARLAGDASLTASLTAEINARVRQGIQLQTAINANTTRINQERDARIKAIAAIQLQIDEAKIALSGTESDTLAQALANKISEWEGDIDTLQSEVQLLEDELDSAATELVSLVDFDAIADANAEDYNSFSEALAQLVAEVNDNDNISDNALAQANANTEYRNSLITFNGAIHKVEDDQNRKEITLFDKVLNNGVTVSIIDNQGAVALSGTVTNVNTKNVATDLETPSDKDFEEFFTHTVNWNAGGHPDYDVFLQTRPTDNGPRTIAKVRIWDDSDKGIALVITDEAEFLANAAEQAANDYTDEQLEYYVLRTDLDTELQNLGYLNASQITDQISSSLASYTLTDDLEDVITDLISDDDLTFEQALVALIQNNDFDTQDLINALNADHNDYDAGLLAAVEDVVNAMVTDTEFDGLDDAIAELKKLANEKVEAQENSEAVINLLNAYEVSLSAEFTLPDSSTVSVSFTNENFPLEGTIDLGKFEFTSDNDAAITVNNMVFNVATDGAVKIETASGFDFDNYTATNTIDLSSYLQLAPVKIGFNFGSSSHSATPSEYDLPFNATQVDVTLQADSGYVFKDLDFDNETILDNSDVAIAGLSMNSFESYPLGSTEIKVTFHIDRTEFVHEAGTWNFDISDYVIAEEVELTLSNLDTNVTLSETSVTLPYNSTSFTVTATTADGYRFANNACTPCTGTGVSGISYRFVTSADDGTTEAVVTVTIESGFDRALLTASPEFQIDAEEISHSLSASTVGASVAYTTIGTNNDNSKYAFVSFTADDGYDFSGFGSGNLTSTEISTLLAGSTVTLGSNVSGNLAITAAAVSDDLDVMTIRFTWTPTNANLDTSISIVLPQLGTDVCSRDLDAQVSISQSKGSVAITGVGTSTYSYVTITGSYDTTEALGTVTEAYQARISLGSFVTLTSNKVLYVWTDGSASTLTDAQKAEVRTAAGAASDVHVFVANDDSSEFYSTVKYTASDAGNASCDGISDSAQLANGSIDFAF